MKYEVRKIRGDKGKDIFIIDYFGGYSNCMDNDQNIGAVNSIFLSIKRKIKINKILDIIDN